MKPKPRLFIFTTLLLLAGKLLPLGLSDSLMLQKYLPHLSDSSNISQSFERLDSSLKCLHRDHMERLLPLFFLRQTAFFEQYHLYPQAHTSIDSVIYYATYDSLKTAAYLTKAQLYKQEHKSAEELKLYLALLNDKSLKIGKRQALQIFGNIASIFADEGDYQKTEDFSWQMIRLARELEDTSALFKAFNLRGLAFLNADNTDSAKAWFGRSRQFIDHLKPSLKAVAWNNQAVSLYYEKQYQKARQVLEKSKAIFIQTGNKEKLSTIYSNIGYLLFIEGEYDKAEFYYNKALETAVEAHSDKGKLGAFSNLSELYQKTGDYAKAFTFQDKYYKLRDSVWDRQNTKELHELQARNDLKLKEKELYLKKQQEHKLAQSEYKAAQIRFYFALSVGGLTLVSSFILFMMVRHIKKQNRQLSITNTLIRKQSENLKKYNDELKKLSMAVNKTQNAIIITDAEGHFEWCNQGFHDYYKLLNGKEHLEPSVTIYEFIRKEKFDQACRLSLQNNDTVDFELKFTMKDGSIRYFQSSLTAIKEAGKHSGNILVSTDITELKLANQKIALQNTELKKLLDKYAHARDAAEAANRAKSAFLANMSHEIRTPMNGIIGMSEILKQTKLTKAQAEYNDIIYKSAISLLDIINDILDFSKIEARKVKLENIPINVAEIINNVGDITALKAEDKGLELLIYTDTDIPPSVYGDPVRLRQILINLVNNAIKFTEKGEINIQAQTVEKTKDRITIRFSVKDTGIGIPKDVQSKLFHAFSQADNSITRKFGGTGLGLNISAKLVELYGGRIQVYSKPGVGSEFFFEISFSIDHRNDRRRQIDLSRHKILIIDDHPHNILIYQKYFEYWKNKVDSALLPSEALEKINALKEEHFYDLIVCDYHMPEMNGMKLIKKIKRRRKAKTCKVILASSVSSLLNSGSKEDKLIDFTLTKPIKFSRLEDAIRHCLFNVHSSKQNPQHREKEESRKALKILIAEDNTINQKVAKITLEKLGHQVRIAKNGALALEARKIQDFDLILMDLHMPEMDGEEATRRIREWEKEKQLSPIPIIALTANIIKGEKERLLEAGMNDYISKPFRVEELKAAIEKATQGHEASHEAGK